MHLVVVTLAPTLTINNKLSAYAPYVKEMNLWFKYSDKITIVCPTQYSKKLLKTSFKRQDIEIISIPFLIFNSFFKALTSFFKLPLLFWTIYKQMRKADHIHLRCPGNIGLIGSIVQICFPKKVKTAKYAGNWDPEAKQPLSYKLQKRLLQNTFLTKNMTVLVYGSWPNQSKNIKPFFTATYTENEKSELPLRDFSSPLKALFVGTMGANKRPFEAVKLIHMLRKEGIDISLEMYGEGPVSQDIKWYRKENGIRDYIILKGNQPAEVVKQAYKEAHFMILPSKSEGWPKVVAEAMWWGCIPIVTPVSCVPWMLDNGQRGLLLDMDIKKDVSSFKYLIQNSKQLETISKKAQQWSQEYTLDHFEAEIQKLLQ